MSSARNVLDIKKAAASRAKARDEMLPETPKPRPQRLRDRRRRQRILVGCICLMSALGLAGGLGALSHLEQFAVKDVSVTGVAALQPESLVAAVHAGLESDGFTLFARDNMFLYPKRAIEAEIVRDFPRVREVTVSRPSLLAQAVVVAVQERQPYAKWCDSACYLIDSAGFVFAEAGNEAPTVPYEFRGGLSRDHAPVGQWFLRGRLAEAVTLLDRFAAAGFTPSALEVETESDFTVTLAAGPEIYMPFGESAESLLHRFEAAVESEALAGRMSELQYIDLRFGNRVYYK